MTVNGESYPFRDGLTLHALLDELRIDRRTVAVMRGDDIYRGERVPDVPLADPDVVEIVTMMQGG